MGRKGRLLTVVLGLLLYCSFAYAKTTTDIAIATSRVQIGSNSEASASCVSIDSDRPYADKDCDGSKDAGEEYLDLTGGGLSDADYGDITVSGGGTVMSIDTDAVSADELNATGVEAELEAVLDLQDLQGAVTDAQVPNTITIDLATTVTTNANLTGPITSVGNATTITADSVTLTTHTTGAYVGSVGEGFSIDTSSTGSEGGTSTVSFDSTEFISDNSWGNASDLTMKWTYLLSASARPYFQAYNKGFEFGMSNLDNSENLKYDFETTANTVGISSTTGVTSINTGSIGIASTFTGNLTGDVTGNVSGTSGSTTGNAATVTFADAGGDTTTFPALGTAATGSLAPVTDAGLSYNATTNALTATTFVGALSGNASTVTTNANLTGDVTSVGNSTTIADNVTVSGWALGTIASGVGTALTALDGENIQDDTIDDDSIDFADVTGADLTLTDSVAVTTSGKIISNANLDVKNGATTSGVIAIFEDSDAGTNKATFEVPSLAADTVYVLPADDGDAGEQLQTNGSGTLTWEPSAAVGSSGWTDNGATVNSTAAGDNFIIGSTSGTAGTSGAGVLGLVVGTAPSTSPTDTVQLYAKDGTDTTKVMLHMNGTDTSTTITDSSSLAATFTARGNAQIDTAQYKFGSASCLFDGSGDYVDTGDASWMDVGTGAFTLELFLRFNSHGGGNYPALIDMGGYASGVRLLFNGDGNVLNLAVISSAMTFAFTPSDATWYHVAIARDGSNVRAFIDGTQVGTTQSNSGNVTGLTLGLSCGGPVSGSAESGSGYQLNGWIDEVRVLAGTAAYTSNFTAPVAELPNSNAKAELLVRDEAGNITTLSPHNTEGIPTDVLTDIKNARHIPMTIHHTSPDGLNEEWIDIVSMAKLLEQSTGKKLIYSKLLMPKGLTLKKAKDLVEAEHPDLDQTNMPPAEIVRRATWVKAKVDREAEFQLAQEKAGVEYSKPPKWMKKFVDAEKERIISGD